MYLKRMAEGELISLLNAPKVIIVLGARQVGKTTLVKHVLSGKKYQLFNLDIEVDKQRVQAIASLPPIDALKSIGNPDFIVIDEAQRLADAGRIVKGWFDAQIPVKIVLLGSSSLNLLNQSAESLTGRNEKLFLPPLLFREIIENQSWYSSSLSDAQILEIFPAQIQELLIQNMVFGNYPEVSTTSDKTRYLLNLVSDYLLKDILQLGLVKTPDIIKRLLMLLAHQIGSEVSVSELANGLNISRQTVERYLALLEQTYVIFRLPAFSTNPRKEINKSHKIYFWDTGIRNAMLNDFSLNQLRADIGALWENWVIAEFAKQNLLQGQRSRLFFWRSRSSGEVDLVIKKDEIINAFEIKWKKQTINKRSFTARYGASVQLIDSSNPFIPVNL
ncbi:MAG: ATP-binding protein [Candidatus Margulisbacteria bacterium]|nr:ATP-binding protein [Candidatus Margulisiibacteriota bacterium]